MEWVCTRSTRRDNGEIQGHRRLMFGVSSWQRVFFQRSVLQLGSGTRSASQSQWMPEREQSGLVQGRMSREMELDTAQQLEGG